MYSALQYTVTARRHRQTRTTAALPRRHDLRCPSRNTTRFLAVITDIVCGGIGRAVVVLSMLPPRVASVRIRLQPK